MTAAAGDRPLREDGSAQALPGRAAASANDPLFWMLVVFLALEYMRPPFFVQLKLQMLITIALPILCYNRIKDRPWSRILALQLALLLFMALHIPLARNNYSAYFTTRIMFGDVAIAVSMAWLLANRTYFKRGIWVWVLVMTYVGQYGITHGGTGPGGFLGDENDLALACNTALPMAYFGVEWSRGWRRWAYAGIGVVLVGAVVMSMSRGGFLGLTAMFGYCWLVSKHKLRNLALVLVSAIAMLLVAPQEYIDEIVSIGAEARGEKEHGTGDARLFLWQSAFNMWKANPLIGVGGGNFNWAVGEYQPAWEGRQYDERNWSGQATHSLYFQFLAELGLVGVGLFISIVVAHFVLLRRVRLRARSDPRIPPSLRADMEIYSGALSGAMIGYLASGAFLSVAYYPYPYYFSGLAVALTAMVNTELRKLDETRSAAPPNPATESPSPKLAATDSSPTQSAGPTLSDLLTPTRIPR